MVRRYSFQLITTHNQPLHFSWDSDNGELSGEDAEQVRVLCLTTAMDSYAVSHPHPATYDIHDPLHRPSEMAVALGQYWRLESDDISIPLK